MMTDETRIAEAEAEAVAVRQEEEEEEEEEEEIITALSTAALEHKLQTLRDQSNKHSQALTQKLATSQSGQNLLHIGSSLSTLPPDLHALLTQLHPVLSAAETTEKLYSSNLQKIVAAANDFRLEQRRVDHGNECADLYDHLCAAEDHIKLLQMRQTKRNISLSQLEISTAEKKENTVVQDELDRAASLERSANTALCLVQDLHTSSEQVSTLSGTNNKNNTENLPSLKTPLEHDTERAQFVMKLAPRIRKLEADTLQSLSLRLEAALKQIQRQREEDRHRDEEKAFHGDENHHNGSDDKLNHHEQLLIIGHYLRGLVILGKGQEAENAFARVAIMPLIRSKLSMGRLDQGGSRGECAGLPSLLQDILGSIGTTFGPVLRLSESIFDREVDLVTAGVWVPIATALMADAGVKMAIFSPGIASILQQNYVALDTFLSELATRLLLKEDDATKQQGGEESLEQLYYGPAIGAEAIARAQARVYSHAKTAEFTKRWNLPIYYQLRFGDSCTRLNTAIERTQKEGWIANVYGGPEEELEKLRTQYGFDLPLFVEVYGILSSFWTSNVFLRPLTHRFLRGAVQVIGRITTFVDDGLEGKIHFGEERKPIKEEHGLGAINGNGESVLEGRRDRPSVITRDPYKWGDSLEDVAAVAWELTVLESKLTHEYTETAQRAAIGAGFSGEEEEEMAALVKDFLADAASKIAPLVQKAWNDTIVNLLITKCSGPLAAVKGVAATYRMTNRPPPTQASPFVPTILRPLLQFNDEFKRRIPPPIGIRWKMAVVNTIAERYSVAVEELIATVQRTEVALQSRRARKTIAGGMSDGEKAKLQLYLDYKEFVKSVQAVGVDPLLVDGVSKLRTLTQDAENRQNGNS